MEKAELKQKALAYIDEHAEELMKIGRELYAMPETGFQEFKTSAYVKDVLTGMGLEVKDKLAITGLKAKATGKQHKANVAVMGELDSLMQPGHPKCDPKTGAFHGCGHHAQLTTILGVAKGLVESGYLKELDGDLTFIGVPAEETLEFEMRRGLAREGKIEFLSGKQELMRLGEFEGIDIVLCSHIMGRTPDPHAWAGHSWNGMLNKTISFYGKSSHAALAPHKGINALEAALCAMNNINALRESFNDEDHVRVHYIITKGGASANIIPDHVTIEMGVRAATVEALLSANKRVEAAIRMASEVIGTTVEIKDSGMYLPCRQNEKLGKIYIENATEIIGEAAVTNSFGEHRGSSTDCGDVACMLPMLHPYFGGAVDEPHGKDFDVINEYAAYVVPAKLATATVIDLLWDNAAEAREIRDSFTPAFASTEEYLAEARSHMAYD